MQHRCGCVLVTCFVVCFFFILHMQWVWLIVAHIDCKTQNCWTMRIVAKRVCNHWFWIFCMLSFCVLRGFYSFFSFSMSLLLNSVAELIILNFWDDPLMVALIVSLQHILFGIFPVASWASRELLADSEILKRVCFVFAFIMSRFVMMRSCLRTSRKPHGVQQGDHCIGDILIRGIRECCARPPSFVRKSRAMSSPHRSNLDRSGRENACALSQNHRLLWGWALLRWLAIQLQPATGLLRVSLLFSSLQKCFVFALRFIVDSFLCKFSVQCAWI